MRTNLKNDVKKLKWIRKISRLAARAYRLPLKEVFINEALEAGDMWGCCHVNYGAIELRLRSKEGYYLKQDFVMSILAHELAHLAEPNHGKAHRALAVSIHGMLKRYY